MSKKAVIILGAGVPLAWDGPITSKITKLLIDCSEFQTINKKNLALYIRNKLVAFYDCEEYEINFEHIVNALETLSDFLYESIKGAPPQFVGSKPIWFTLSETFSEIENYTFEKYSQDPSRGLLFNKATPGDSPYVSVGADSYQRYYVLEVIKRYLQIIRREIHSYDISCVEQKYDSVNKGLWDFYTRLKKDGYIVRFYTTNYDELFPKIFREQHGVTLYSGFDQVMGHTTDYLPNPKKILMDKDVECYYNLHGSTYWKNATNARYEYSFAYTEGTSQTSEDAHSVNANPVERTNIYNIVTGFSKLQKISVEPLKSFFNALAFDSINADLIVSIGYSYSDNHINNILHHAIVENDAKLLHITFSDNILGVPEYINMQGCVVIGRERKEFEKKDSNWQITKNKKVFIYSAGFKSFIENKEWELKDLWS